MRHAKPQAKIKGTRTSLTPAQKAIKQAKSQAIKEATELQRAEFFGKLQAAGLPVPVPEYQFSADRKFRFDFAWISAKLALEIEGGIWTAGRHTRGSGFLKDMEKYNLALLQGWRVYRTTPDKLTTPQTIKDIAALLEM